MNNLKQGEKTALVLLSIFVAFQVFMPLRHFLYPGNVSWTEEGHNFAWHMKLRDKTGKITFEIRDPKTGNTWDLDPEVYLTKRQRHKMATRPYLTLQFAHYIEEQFKEMGYENVEVTGKGKGISQRKEKNSLLSILTSTLQCIMTL